MLGLAGRLMLLAATGLTIFGGSAAWAFEPEGGGQDGRREGQQWTPSGPPPIEVDVYPGGSRVLVQEFASAALGQSMTYRVMLPPGYAETDRRFPVLYMLHGVAGDSTEWEELGLLSEADGLMTSGAIEPFLIVLPYGGASYWVNHADDGLGWADYLVYDVVASVDRQYRTIPNRAGRAIGGLSMGGEGALQLALRHPDTFIAVGAHSPSLRTDFAQLTDGARAYYGDAWTWRAASPFWLVVDEPRSAALLSIWLDVGTDDPWRPNVEALHQRMLDEGIRHEMHVIEGEHDGSYWTANLPSYLRFYASAFYPALATTRSQGAQTW